MAKPIEGVRLSPAQKKWLSNQVQTKKVDPKKQAAVERRERTGAQRVTMN